MSYTILYQWLGGIQLAKKLSWRVQGGVSHSWPLSGITTRLEPALPFLQLQLFSKWSLLSS